MLRPNESTCSKRWQIRGHFTAEEVWERVKDTLPGLELSTVYRLEALRGVGLVADSRLPKGVRVFEVHELHVAARGCAPGAPAVGRGKSFRRVRRREWEQ